MQSLMEWESLKKQVRDEQCMLDRHMRELHSIRLHVSETFDKHLIGEIECDIRTKLDKLDEMCLKLNDLSQGKTARHAHITRVKEMTSESRNELARVSTLILN